MKIINKIVFFICSILACSCSNYLDVVPDNLATIEHAFGNRVNAEKYLFTCYSYLPDPTSPNRNQALMSGNECWINLEDNHYYFGSIEAFDIARGYQNTNKPLLNYWEGDNGGTNLFIAIRDCNIFIENIHKPADLEQYDRDKWIAEVKFLKAYYHFYLLRMYGPIPIIDKNLPVSASPSEVKVYREPIDKVVEYIVSLLDESANVLPSEIQNQTQEMGHITKTIALALKAKVLTLAASPIFNGNPYYVNITDNRGVSLFPEAYDAKKWVTAGTAIKEAIDCALSAGHDLYYYKGYNPISDSTRNKLNLRNAVTERWNKEIIWGSTKSDAHLQKVCMIRTKTDQASNNNLLSIMSPTLDIAEQFYTKNGVPIDEDTNWGYYDKRYKTHVAEPDHKYYIKTGYETANLNFDREVRFYSSLFFDGCIVYGNGIINDNDSKIGYGQMKKGQPGGIVNISNFSLTGYTPQKLVNFESVAEGNNFTQKRYSFPIIRLADLYLMMAEALNETKEVPDNDVYQWIDLVRTRASLKGVVDSWRLYSSNPTKPLTQKGMREIIHRERLNELAFEGERYWDLLRWKEAEIYMNKPIRGWNVTGETVEEYYEVKIIDRPQFTTKNYLSPLQKSTIDINSNLRQNPGW